MAPYVVKDCQGSDDGVDKVDPSEDTIAVYRGIKKRHKGATNDTRLGGRVSLEAKSEQGPGYERTQV